MNKIDLIKELFSLSVEMDRISREMREFDDPEYQLHASELNEIRKHSEVQEKIDFAIKILESLKNVSLYNTSAGELNLIINKVIEVLNEK